MKVYWGSPDREKSGELIGFQPCARLAGRRLGTFMKREKFYSRYAKVLFTHPNGMKEVVLIRETKIRKKKETNMRLTEWLQINCGKLITSYPTRVDGKMEIVSMYAPRKRLVCNDGFSVSVQEGHCLHSTTDENGNVTHVELGFPSAPIPQIAEHKDGGADDPDTDCVYGYVPVEKVEELIAAHGGIKLDQYWVIKGMDDYEVVSGDEQSVAANFLIVEGPFDRPADAQVAIDKIWNDLAEESLDKEWQFIDDPNY